MAKIDIDDAYDLLHEIRDTEEHDIKTYFNHENVAILEVLWIDFFDTPCMNVNDVSEFQEMVSLLDEREAQLSRDLGTAILKASKYKKQGDMDEATRVLNEFIDTCCSQSYKEIALIELDNE